MTVPLAQLPKDERHRCLDYVVLLPDLLRGLRDIASTAHDTQDAAFNNVATNLVTKLVMLMNGVGHWWNGFKQRQTDLFDPDSDSAGYDATKTSSADLLAAQTSRIILPVLEMSLSCYTTASFSFSATTLHGDYCMTVDCIQPAPRCWTFSP